MTLFTDNLKKSFYLLFLTVFFLSAGLVQIISGQQGLALFPEKPQPAIFVHDYSGWLTPEQKNKLEKDLRSYHDSTSTQILLMIRPDIGDYDLSSYAFELGERWGVGTKDFDNGIIILAKTESPGRGIFIATGYGVEEFLTDALSKRIIESIFLPNFRQGDYYKGLNEGIEAIRQVLSGQFKGIPDEQDKSPINWIIVLIVIIIIIKTIGSNSGRMMTGKGAYGTGFPVGFPGGYYGGGGRGSIGRTGGGGFGGSFGGGSFGGGGAGGGGAGGSW